MNAPLNQWTSTVDTGKMKLVTALPEASMTMSGDGNRPAEDKSTVPVLPLVGGPAPKAGRSGYLELGVL
jgi:hypothetical protein